MVRSFEIFQKLPPVEKKLQSMKKKRYWGNPFPLIPRNTAVMMALILGHIIYFSMPNALIPFQAAYAAGSIAFASFIGSFVTFYYFGLFGLIKRFTTWGGLHIVMDQHTPEDRNGKPYWMMVAPEENIFPIEQVKMIFENSLQDVRAMQTIAEEEIQVLLDGINYQGAETIFDPETYGTYMQLRQEKEGYGSHIALREDILKDLEKYKEGSSVEVQGGLRLRCYRQLTILKRPSLFIIASAEPLEHSVLWRTSFRTLFHSYTTLGQTGKISCNIIPLYPYQNVYFCHVREDLHSDRLTMDDWYRFMLELPTKNQLSNLVMELLHLLSIRPDPAQLEVFKAHDTQKDGILEATIKMHDKAYEQGYRVGRREVGAGGGIWMPIAAISWFILIMMWLFGG